MSLSNLSPTSTPLRTISPQLLRPSLSHPAPESDSDNRSHCLPAFTPYPHAIFPLTPYTPYQADHPLCWSDHSSRIWMTSDWSALPVSAAGGADDSLPANDLPIDTTTQHGVLSLPGTLDPIPRATTAPSSIRKEHPVPPFIPRQLVYPPPDTSSTANVPIGGHSTASVHGPLAPPIELHASLGSYLSHPPKVSTRHKVGGRRVLSDESDEDSEPEPIDIDLGARIVTQPIRGKKPMMANENGRTSRSPQFSVLVRGHRSTETANENDNESENEDGNGGTDADMTDQVALPLELELEPISKNGRYPARMSSLRSPLPSSDEAAAGSSTSSPMVRGRGDSSSQARKRKMGGKGASAGSCGTSGKKKGSQKGKSTPRIQSHSTSTRTPARDSMAYGSSSSRSHPRTATQKSDNIHVKGLKQLPTGSFLWTAMHMLTLPKHSEYVYWDERSREAYIPDVDAFAENVYSKYCSSNLWTSFQRNMTNYQGWGYKRLAVEGSNLKQQTITVPTFETITQRWTARGLPLETVDSAQAAYLSAKNGTDPKADVRRAGHAQRPPESKGAGRPKIALKYGRGRGFGSGSRNAQNIEEERLDDQYSEEEMGGMIVVDGPRNSSPEDVDANNVDDSEDEDSPLAVQQMNRMRGHPSEADVDTHDDRLRSILGSGGKSALSQQPRRFASLGGAEDIDEVLFSPVYTPSPTFDTPLLTPATPAFPSPAPLDPSTSTSTLAPRGAGYQHSYCTPTDMSDRYRVMQGDKRRSH